MYLKMQFVVLHWQLGLSLHKNFSWQFPVLYGYTYLQFSHLMNLVMVTNMLWHVVKTLLIFTLAVISCIMTPMLCLWTFC